jgi:hypothetical protein
MKKTSDQIGDKAGLVPIAHAKRRKANKTDSALVDFAEAFKAARGTIDAELELGY